MCSDDQRRAGQAYRVWIGRYDAWRPRHARDRPPRLVATGPAEVEPMSVGQARRYAAVFNRTALASGRRVWAVVVPVVVRYEGEPRPGEILKVRVAAQSRVKMQRSRRCQ